MFDMKVKKDTTYIELLYFIVNKMRYSQFVNKSDSMNVTIDKNIHTSVLLAELVDAINIKDDSQNIIVDGTL